MKEFCGGALVKEIETFLFAQPLLQRHTRKKLVYQYMQTSLNKQPVTKETLKSTYFESCFLTVVMCKAAITLSDSNENISEEQ